MYKNCNYTYLSYFNAFIKSKILFKKILFLLLYYTVLKVSLILVYRPVTRGAMGLKEGYGAEAPPPPKCGKK